MASFQYVTNIKIIVIFYLFNTKFSKSGVYFRIIAHLNSK